MFINLTARKSNGDFMITSSDVLLEKHPTASMAEISEMLSVIAEEYHAMGYKLEVSFLEV
jgi:hypothetical protein